VPQNFRADKIDETVLQATVDMQAQAPYFKQFYVRWVDFCDAVDKANTIKGLEKVPTSGTLYRAPQHMAGGSATMSAEAVEATKGTLESLKEQIRVKGVLVKHFFQDFEANQNSVMLVNHVTHQQFQQCLSRLEFALSRAEIEAIGVFFDDRGDGTINYRNFVNHVDPAPPSINPWKTNSNGLDTAGGGAGAVPARKQVPESALAIVDRVKDCCSINRIRIHEFFQNFDRLRRC
jgi:hypothetical protein